MLKSLEIITVEHVLNEKIAELLASTDCENPILALAAGAITMCLASLRTSGEQCTSLGNTAMTKYIHTTSMFMYDHRQDIENSVSKLMVYPEVGEDWMLQQFKLAYNLPLMHEYIEPEVEPQKGK